MRFGASVLVFCIGDSDAVWGIGDSERLGVGPFYVFLFRHQRAMESNTRIDLGEIFGYMANRYVG